MKFGLNFDPKKIGDFGLAWMATAPFSLILAVIFNEMMLQEVAYYSLTLIFGIGGLLALYAALMKRGKT